MEQLDMTSKLIGILLAVSLSLASWALIKTVDHETRVSVNESDIAEIKRTRFESQDGLALEIKMRSEIRASVDEIKTCLNKIQRNQLCD